MCNIDGRIEVKLGFCNRVIFLIDPDHPRCPVDKRIIFVTNRQLLVWDKLNDVGSSSIHAVLADQSEIKSRDNVYDWV